MLDDSREAFIKLSQLPEGGEWYKADTTGYEWPAAGKRAIAER